MNNSEKLEVDVTIIAGKGTTLKELKNLRLRLFNDMEREFSGDDVEIYQESPSRSVDPTVIGTVSLVLLPIIVEKLADIIIEWVKGQKECSITINVPVKGTSPIIIMYDPRTTSPARLKKWINSAVEFAQLLRK